MATHFSANQYENAFRANKLSNWQVPSQYREKPRKLGGFTQIIANDRGHLMENGPKSKDNPWGNFVGTWDLPRKIPGNCARVRTARTSYAQQKLQGEAADASRVLTGSAKNDMRNTFKAYGNTMGELSDQPGDRSGAAAPASQMIPSGSPKVMGSAPGTPIQEPLLENRTPTPPVRSPIPPREIPQLGDTTPKPPNDLPNQVHM